MAFLSGIPSTARRKYKEKKEFILKLYNFIVFYRNMTDRELSYEHNRRGVRNIT